MYSISRTLTPTHKHTNTQTRTTGPSFLDLIEHYYHECGNDAAFQQVYQGMLLSLLFTIFSAISALIMSTFYFLFIPNELESYKKWRNKARLIVLSIFLLTSVSITSLISLTYRLLGQYFVPSSVDLCTNYINMYGYIFPFFGFSFLTFIFSIYLVL